MIQKEFAKFNHILFNDEHHTYIDTKDGFQFVSGTGFIKKFQKPFDPEIVNKSAVKHGVDAEALQREWDLKAKLGKLRGTIIHKYCEDRWQNKIFPINHPKWILNLPIEETVKYISSVEKLKLQAEDYYFTYHERYLPVKLEPIIGDRDLGVATMVDKIVYDIILNAYGIIDYKTDKKVDKSSRFGNKFLEPISHLDDCELNKYSIQTQISKHILEKNTNIEIAFRKIVWFNTQNPSFVVMDCLDMSKEVELMFDCYG